MPVWVLVTCLKHDEVPCGVYSSAEKGKDAAVVAATEVYQWEVFPEWRFEEGDDGEPDCWEAWLPDGSAGFILVEFTVDAEASP